MNMYSPPPAAQPQVYTPTKKELREAQEFVAELFAKQLSPKQQQPSPKKQNININNVIGQQNNGFINVNEASAMQNSINSTSYTNPPTNFFSNQMQKRARISTK
eukprot:UN34751